MNKSKLNYLLTGFPTELINKFKIDEVGMYSITPVKDSLEYFTDIHNFIKVKNPHVLDICSSVGGDSINIGRIFGYVDSNELDDTRYTMLKHNLSEAKKFYPFVSRTFNKDANEFFDNKTVNENMNKGINKVYSRLPRGFYDLVYMDPPWGGENYYKEKNLKMYFGSTEVHDFINNELYKRTNYVAIKGPSNFNLDINKLNHCKLVKEYKLTISQKKKTYYKVYLLKFDYKPGETPKNSNILKFK